MEDQVLAERPFGCHDRKRFWYYPMQLKHRPFSHETFNMSSLSMCSFVRESKLTYVQEQGLPMVMNPDKATFQSTCNVVGVFIPSYTVHAVHMLNVLCEKGYRISLLCRWKSAGHPQRCPN